MTVYRKVDFDRIANAINVPSDGVGKFDKQFEAAATWYQLDKNAPKRLAPSILARRLESIVGHARGLLKALGVDDASEAADGPGDVDVLEALTVAEDSDEEIVIIATLRIGRLAELLSAAGAAADLERWAKAAAKDAVRVRRQISLPGHQGDLDINEWIAAMLGHYRQITGNNPKTSVGSSSSKNEGKAGGPLIRFLVAAGSPLKIAMSHYAWRERVRLILRHNA